MRNTQLIVYNTLKQYGPLADHALVPIVQHESLIDQSSSGIRTRRAELAKQGRVRIVGQMKMPSGRWAAIWKAV